MNNKSNIMLLLLSLLVLALSSCNSLPKLSFDPLAGICAQQVAEDGQTYRVCYNPISKTYSASYKGGGGDYTLVYDPSTKTYSAILPTGRIEYKDGKINLIPLPVDPVK